MEHIKIEIKGVVYKYTQLTAELGYCFYDVDDEERQYITSIATPITDINELSRKYVVVSGNADVLNEQLQQEKDTKDV